jgi:hypothetical protein
VTARHYAGISLRYDTIDNPVPGIETGGWFWEVAPAHSDEISLSPTRVDLVVDLASISVST